MDMIPQLFSQETVDALAPYGKVACLVTGRHFLMDAGLLEKMYSFLRYHGFKVYIFDKIMPEPEDETIRLGADKFLENQCDFIIAIGGGSVLDAGKAIAILARNGGVIYDYKTKSEFEHEPVPLIAVPTTCGSGSEVTRYAVISNKEPKEKFTIKSDQIVPKQVVLDPQMLRTLPDEEMIITAFDASSHMLETFLFHMGSSELHGKNCLEGLRRLFLVLRPALERRSDEHLRELQQVAMLAGKIIHSERTGLPHTLGNKISGFVPIKHGLINALTIPPCLAMIEEKEATDVLFEQRMSQMKQLLDELGLWRGRVSSSLAEFYGSFPVGYEHKLSFDQETAALIVTQTARDAGLFQITPKGLTQEELPLFLARVVEAINENQ